MKYFATFVESGTNYRCYIEAETREGIETQLLGRVYPPKQATLAIYETKVYKEHATVKRMSNV